MGFLLVLFVFHVGFAFLVIFVAFLTDLFGIIADIPQIYYTYIIIYSQLSFALLLDLVRLVSIATTPTSH